MEDKTMRKLIMWNLMTLDGYFEGGQPNDLSWFVFDDDMQQYIFDAEEEVGGYVFGRETYEMMAGYWPGEEGRTADFMNRIPKFVFSTTMPSADWNNTLLFRGEVASEIKRLKSEPGKDLFVIGSADLATTLTAEGLIDEYRIAVNPIVLGNGTALFQGDTRVDLKLVQSTVFGSGVVVLRYEPLGEQRSRLRVE
jgi:dihydrofolate reductase